MVRLNLGCGSTPLENYINDDKDSLEDLKERYPNKTFPDCRIENWDIFNLPLEDNSVDEVRADCLFEHLDFREEKRAFEEVKRVLKPKGIFNLSVPDFEDVVKNWIKAEDNWIVLYRDDDDAISKKHWFGNYEYNFTNRWGYITASLFGSQNGEGQYHKNCYTIGKLRNIFKKLNFIIESEESYIWPRGKDKILKVIAKKQ